MREIRSPGLPRFLPADIFPAHIRSGRPAALSWLKDENFSFGNCGRRGEPITGAGAECDRTTAAPVVRIAGSLGAEADAAEQAGTREGRAGSAPGGRKAGPDGSVGAECDSGKRESQGNGRGDSVFAGRRGAVQDTAGTPG